MVNAYLETSTLNQALEDGLTGSGLNQLGQAAEYRVCIGMHTIYEMARTFLNPKQHLRGTELFSILRDIECSYVPMISQPIENQEYLEQLRSSGVPKPRLNFDQFLADFPHLPELISAVVTIRITANEAALLARRLDEFPCIRAVVRANVYFAYIMARNRVPPSYDRTDDFRQVADAAYCDAFISNDRQLLKTTNFISPQLHPVSWSTFCAQEI